MSIKKQYERLITRKEAVELMQNELGLPVGLSSFECGKGKLRLCDEESAIAPPMPVSRYGHVYLYSPQAIRQWGERLIQRGL
jgi:hypothetical protein